MKQHNPAKLFCRPDVLIYEYKSLLSEDEVQQIDWNGPGAFSPGVALGGHAFYVFTNGEEAYSFYGKPDGGRGMYKIYYSISADIFNDICNTCYGMRNGSWEIAWAFAKAFEKHQLDVRVRN
jgi:hypothetical protein